MSQPKESQVIFPVHHGPDFLFYLIFLFQSVIFMEINSPQKTLELKKQHIAKKASTSEELWKINSFTVSPYQIQN